MFLRLILVCLTLPMMALAQNLPTPLSDTISDFADLLPPGDEARLAGTLRQIRDETGVQVVVATMERIADHGGSGLRVEDYAKRLFNAWGIGDSARNDGILVLVARVDRVTRIALGSGYDAVYDGRASRVIETAMLPEFREDRYVAGIEAGVASVRERLVAPFVAGEKVTQTSGFGSPDRLMLLFPAGLVAAFLAFAFRRRIGDFAARFHRCEKCNQRGLSRSRDIVRAATGTAAGQAVLRDHCKTCGHDRTQSYAVAARQESSGKGGGSSGFGGGGSSGGGATGRW